MQATIQQYIEGISDQSISHGLRVPLRAIGDRMASQSLISAVLAISGGSASPTVATSAVYYGTAKGSLVRLASATALPALVGTVANAMYNVFVFYANSASALTTLMGVPGTTLGAVTFPQPPENCAMIGFVIVHPTGVGAFIGGTTNLDDATVIPGAVFINTIGAFDPTILL